VVKYILRNYKRNYYERFRG